MISVRAFRHIFRLSEASGLQWPQLFAQAARDIFEDGHTDDVARLRAAAQVTYFIAHDPTDDDEYLAEGHLADALLFYAKTVGVLSDFRTKHDTLGVSWSVGMHGETKIEVPEAFMGIVRPGSGYVQENGPVGLTRPQHHLIERLLRSLSPTLPSPVVVSEGVLHV